MDYQVGVRYRCQEYFVTKFATTAEAHDFILKQQERTDIDTIALEKKRHPDGWFLLVNRWHLIDNKWKAMI